MKSESFTLNIWMGIESHRFQDLVVNILIGDAYVNYLQNTMSDFLNDIPLYQSQ